MKQFDPDDFVSFTIVLNGCSFTGYSWERMRTEWRNIPSGFLYGNRANGEREQLDARY